MKDMKVTSEEMAAMLEGWAWVHVSPKRCGEPGDWVQIGEAKKVLFAVEELPLGLVSRTLHHAAGYTSARRFYDSWTARWPWNRKRKVWVHFLRPAHKWEREVLT
jgi:hypothetical protein